MSLQTDWWACVLQGCQLQYNISGGPGFPRRGGGGLPTYYFANFSLKMHENKEILVEHPYTPLDLPPLPIDLQPHPNPIL